MSVSIYFTYNEFKFTDPESCEYLESVEYYNTKLRFK